MNAQLEARLTAEIGQVIDDHIAPLFRPGARITVLVRHPGMDDADAAVTSDTDAGVYAIVQRRFPRAASGEAEIARLSAALAETRAQLEEERARNAATWLPMGTAPHDGTTVLVILPVWNVPHAAAFERGYWHEQFSGQPLAGKAAPTHWRPLPAPPLAIIPKDAP